MDENIDNEDIQNEQLNNNQNNSNIPLNNNQNITNQEQDSAKKLGQIAGRGAADYFTGGKYETLRNAPVVGKAAKKAEEQVGDHVAKIDKLSGGNIGKVAKKADDVGLLDAADKGLDIAGEYLGKGSGGTKKSGTNNSAGNGAGALKNSGILNKTGAKTNTNNVNNKLNKVPNQKNIEQQDTINNELQENQEQIEEQNEINNYSNEVEQNNKVEEKVKAEKRKKVLTFIMSHLPLIIGIIIALIIIISIIYAIFMVIIVADDDEQENNYYYGCGSISITQTSLSKDQFVESVKNSVSNYIFASNAAKIYEIATHNNINPELVVIRAKLEGFSPGVGNNYWGIACYNGSKKCASYSSFDQGVLAFIQNISKYSTVEEMMGKYTYIGDYWFNPGGSGLGGCYYYPYIKQYMSEEQAAKVEAACNSGKSCGKGGGPNCVATTSEDQLAYSKWQVSKMVEQRTSIFGIGEDECEEYLDENGNPVEYDGTPGAQIAQYAVNTYDNYLYSQDTTLRMTTHVDCSSLVYRVYRHFGISMSSSNSRGEYAWCRANNKLISKGELQPGDLIFFSNKDGIHHVSMYIGGGKQFAAHSAKYAAKDQVSVTNYNNNGSYFCRPTK